jgi:D-glycero-alpha-D-manno-heptose 1-phosphate guanylyltransferase
MNLRKFTTNPLLVSGVWRMPSLPDAIVLCGGAGLRLRAITGDVPKALASIAGRPFLELLLRQLKRHGFERVILAVGYQQDLIRSHFGDRLFGLTLAYSSESSPLGTGGALRLAVDLVQSESTLIMNGDSYTDADLQEFALEHARSRADASVLVAPADGRSDCGLVVIGPSRKLERFEEKQRTKQRPYLNAGLYMMSRRLLYDIPVELPVSLEQDLFPRWLDEGKHIQAFVCPSRCVDIGTPERYQGAIDVLANAELELSASVRESHL